MKITGLTVHTPDRNYHVLVELQADTGLSGWGSCYSQTPQAVGALSWLKHFVIGEDPLEVERVTEKLHQLVYWHGRGGAMTHGISAVNLALWDLAGRALGQPVSTLLGGRYRDRVPVYGSILFHPVETLPQRIEAMLARHFRAIKLGWDPFGQQSVAEDERLVRIARQAAGNTTEILIDAGGSNPYWTMRFKDALERAKMLANYGVYWFEEPLTPDDIEGYARLTDQSPVKIAHGEVLTRRQTFLPWFQRRAMDIVQPDSTKVGGLSETRRIAWLADQFGIELVPHGWNTALGVAADIHLVSTLHTKSFVEFNVGNVMTETIATHPFQLGDDGCLEVPTTPGLGVEIDRARLKELEQSGFSAPSWTWEEEGLYGATRSS